MRNPDAGPRPPDDRLQRALEVMRQWVESDEPASVCLARNADLQDILAPMIHGSGPDTRTLGGHALLAGRFRLDRCLGRGGMGAVFAATDTKLHRQVAIKLLRAVLQFDDAAHERFRREAALMARLQHPNIVRVLEVGEIDDSPFLVMELVDGVTLSRLLAGLARLPPHTTIDDLERALVTLLPPSSAAHAPGQPRWAPTFERQMVAWAIDIARALDHAHGQGLVHRDVKPGNIMISRDGRALLTDFGLARVQGERGLTLTGEFAGTFEYASPEHFGAPSDLDARSDVFSLGSTLYEMLTRRRPFHAESDLAIRDRVVHAEPRSAAKLSSRVPRDLAAVVARAMEKATSRRYADAGAFAADLERWLHGFPVHARPVRAGTRLRRWIARNRLASAFLVVLLGSTAAVSALAWQTMQVNARLDLDSMAARADRLWNQAGEPFDPDVDAAKLAALRAEVVGACARIPEFTARLRAMQPRATRVDGAAEPAAHPRLLAELDAQRGRKHELSNPKATRNDFLAAEVAAADARIESLQATLDARRGWQHPQQEEFELLTDLVWNLTELRQRQLPRIDSTLTWIHAREQTLVAHATDWARVAEAVAHDVRFAGLTLAPQPGLLPLGPDPLSELQEFLVEGTGSEPPRDPDSGRVRLADATGIVLVLLPGSKRTDAPHVDPSFCSKFELTSGQMRRIAALLPLQGDGMPVLYARYPTRATLPAVDIKWREARDVLRQLGLSLPSGPQWRFACRGDDLAEFWTDTFPAPPADRLAALHEVANLAPRGQVWPCDSIRRANGSLVPAPGNRWGLVHMHGNAGEWLAESNETRMRPLAGGYLGADDSVTGCARFDELDGDFRCTFVGMRPTRRLER